MKNKWKTDGKPSSLGQTWNRNSISQTELTATCKKNFAWDFNYGQESMRKAQLPWKDMISVNYCLILSCRDMHITAAKPHRYLFLHSKKISKDSILAVSISQPHPLKHPTIYRYSIISANHLPSSSFIPLTWWTSKMLRKFSERRFQTISAAQCTTRWVAGIDI